jgi:hypothetical protein
LYLSCSVLVALWSAERMAVQIMLEVSANRTASLHSYLHALKGLRTMKGVESVQIIVWKEVLNTGGNVVSNERQFSAQEQPILTGQDVFTSTRKSFFPKGWLGKQPFSIWKRLIATSGSKESNVRLRFREQLLLAHQCRHPWEHWVCINLDGKKIKWCMERALVFALDCDAHMRSAYMRNGNWIRLEDHVDYTSHILDFSVLNQLVCPIFFCSRPAKTRKRAFLCVWRADIAIHRVHLGAALYRTLRNWNVCKLILSCLFPLKGPRSPCLSMEVYAADHLVLESGFTNEMRAR